MILRSLASSCLPCVVFFFCLGLASCSPGDSYSDDNSSGSFETTQSDTIVESAISNDVSNMAAKPAPDDVASHSDVAACLNAVSSKREMDRVEAELACPIAVTEKVLVKFVGTDETYGCAPQVVAVAPKSSRREYIRVVITHGTQKEYTAVVRLQNRVLRDRKSGWRSYGWPGNPPLEPCSELSMKVVSITCKVSGAPDFLPCEQDVELLPPDLFLTEEFLGT